jgi:pimeloyl-ACP methyl ester carboxylesterase
MRVAVSLALPSVLLAGCFSLGLGEPPPEGLARPERTVAPPLEPDRCESADRLERPDPRLLDPDGGCDPDEEGYCLALRPELRRVAALRDPAVALRHAAEAFEAFDGSGDPETQALARAYADLAVSGGDAYARFAADPPVAVPGAEATAAARALERAYAVAWALRGPPAHRAASRAALGWVAVSPEDDPPARPVNIASSPFPQTDLEVAMTVGGAPRTVRTRVLRASTEVEAAAAAPPADLVGVPPDEPALALPGEGPILVFVHGHASLAEETSTLVEALWRRYRDRGEPATILSMDLPSNAYAERLALEDVGVEEDDAVLRFLDAFLIAFVDALEAETPGASDRIAAILGGSLGGNLVMRLAEREDLPWVRRIVAWSPASIDVSWSRARLMFPEPGRQFVDIVKHEGVRMTRDESEQLEDEDGRREYFVGGVTSVRRQAGFWYRDGWDCGERLVTEGLHQLGEVYDDRFRRWHYRLALEQLLFSHVEVPEDGGPRPFERIAVPFLLIAGERDDAVPMTTYSFVERLAPHLTMPGETLFLEDTGHAMHSERPALLAEEIDAFLRGTRGVAP